ncbi:response regulator [Sinanaerobacter chloroacetimidivorans]|uniref:Stage 0 sporulation protein A homolog n=1 Tax=Sinanaerobacter chloroacetimidivorans TaxID=2818044 RepID=A0A8J7W6W1_9FIRM|nr:response regulator [Sinanaerobacter chloroacetimidivorans]MBR0600183.1 response regulator [Sinanaerobacter chloroacetimidivorans]
MIKLFVADDEEIIRAGIRNCIEKQAEAYTICGEAADGEMALPLIQELKPDILIADVRMPFMDGLDLSALVKRAMPWVHIVIVSGHDEFEYAQKAVSLGVDAYILKPVNSAKLLEVLDDVAERIEKEKKNYLEIEESLKRDELETTILREHFLGELVLGALNLNEALQLAERHKVSLLSKKYMVCQAVLPDFVAGEELARIRLLVNRVLGDRTDSIWFLHGSEQLVFIVKGECETAVREAAYETSQILSHELKRYLSMDVSVGIGSIVDRVGELPKSYADARSVFGSGLIFRGNKIIGFDDLKHDRISRKPAISFNVPLAEQLRHAAPKDLPKILDNYFKEVSDESIDSHLLRYYLLTDLIITVSRLTKEKGDLQRSLSENPQQVFHLASSFEEGRSFALELLTEMASQRSTGSDVPYGQEIRNAREYIDTHYSDPEISLHTVAKQVGFSPSHFSAIFSQETGETFIEYLTKRRIEAAKTLLYDKNNRLHDIALAIGYNDPHYFSYVFKRNTGVSPKEYRNASC